MFYDASNLVFIHHRPIQSFRRRGQKVLTRYRLPPSAGSLLLFSRRAFCEALAQSMTGEFDVTDCSRWRYCGLYCVAKLILFSYYALKCFTYLELNINVKEDESGLGIVT